MKSLLRHWILQTFRLPKMIGKISLHFHAQLVHLTAHMCKFSNQGSTEITIFAVKDLQPLMLRQLVMLLKDLQVFRLIGQDLYMNLEELRLGSSDGQFRDRCLIVGWWGLKHRSLANDTLQRAIKCSSRGSEIKILLKWMTIQFRLTILYLFCWFFK